METSAVRRFQTGKGGAVSRLAVPLLAFGDHKESPHIKQQKSGPMHETACHPEPCLPTGLAVGVSDVGRSIVRRNLHSARRVLDGRVEVIANG
jgi:hypothetical protein